MKKIWVLLVSLMLWCAPAQAGDWNFLHWEPAVKSSVVAFNVLNFIDYHQTINHLHRGGYELNPIAGRHPSDGVVLAGVVAESALQYAITGYLADKNPKLQFFFQGLSVGFKGLNVMWNYRVTEW